MLANITEVLDPKMPGLNVYFQVSKERGRELAVFALEGLTDVSSLNIHLNQGSIFSIFVTNLG